MSKYKYDFLIVGCGLFGSTFADLVTKRGKKVLIIDKRNHIGGNVYGEDKEGINVHKYGAHIFHTNDKSIWDYVNSFTEFNHFKNSPLARINGKQYNLPFNMNTFYQIWGVKTPEEAREKIFSQTAKHKGEVSNLEEQALQLVGSDIYELLIKNYTKKQWGKDPKELPPFIIKRLPLRFTYDNNYFNDRYQGIPVNGYNAIIEGQIDRSDLRLNVDYFKEKSALNALAERVVFTGKIDEYFDYKYGKLEYRSLRFENETLDLDNYQGNAVVNFTGDEVDYTRIIEHKHFAFGNQEKTIITREYPAKYDGKNEPYYPINDPLNQELYKKYRILAKESSDVIFGGRLAEYKYYDMHQIIGSAMVKAKKALGEI